MILVDASIVGEIVPREVTLASRTETVFSSDMCDNKDVAVLCIQKHFFPLLW